MTRLRRSALLLGLAGSTIVLDQVLKILAQRFLEGRPTQIFLGGVVRVEYIRNRGAFLSLGAGLSEPLRFWLLTVAVGVLLVSLAGALFSRKTSLPTSMGLALIIGGGVGNLIDRIAYGSVIDYLNVGIGGLRTGVFNLADSVIMLGLAVILLDLKPGQKAGVRPRQSPRAP